MKMLIEIDDIDFEAIKHGKPISAKVMDALIHGTPLSEGHSDLIDRTELLKAMDTWPKFGLTIDGRLTYPCEPHLVPYVHYDDMVQAVKGMPTIIEADKGVLEQLAEKQNSLSAINKAWSDAIEKNGYVN